MRNLVLTASVLATIAFAPAPGRAADIYTPPPPVYGAAPPPPPVAYVPQPYAYAPPPAYMRGPGIIAVPEGPAYVVPGPAYQAGGEYEEAPALVDARRYYRDCWWEWGYRKCVLRPRALW
jgi:hypothetical protein